MDLHPKEKKGFKKKGGWFREKNVEERNLDNQHKSYLLRSKSSRLSRSRMKIKDDDNHNHFYINYAGLANQDCRRFFVLFCNENRIL